jgi:predicted anti-sigma-YlaC factor YlaD
MVIFDSAVYSLAHLAAVDFVQLRLWVSVWSGAAAVFMAAVSATAAFVNRVTAFTVDVFVALACALYVSSAVQMIVAVSRRMWPETELSSESAIINNQECILQ